MSLNRLLAMQKAAKESQATGTTPAAEGGATQESGPAGPPASTPAPAPPSLKLPFGNAKPKPVTPAPTPAPAPKQEALSLDNLGSFDLSSIDESEPEDNTEFAGFMDEIEATAPDRELPEDITPEMAGFVESLNTIYTILNDPEMFGQQIRQIMMELQENPEYEKLISDTDVHVMIRAMRNTMGLARVKKQAKKRGTAASKSRAPSKRQALMDKALAITTGFGIEVD
jgi:hypothetical protein